MLKPQEDSLEIDANDGVEIGLGQFLNRSCLAWNARVVEGDVDASETLEGALMKGGDVSCFTDVKLLEFDADFGKLRFDFLDEAEPPIRSGLFLLSRLRSSPA
jgi:hypothetical protein